MISTMELMEKKTPSIKNNDRKKGMTLVEVMAAMAILSILFMAISSLIIGIVKSEAKSERKLESDGYLKNALLMFDSGIVSPSNSLSFTVKFDDVIEMQDEIEKMTSGGEGVYTLIITSSEEGNLYKVNAEFLNERDEHYSKHIYVLKNK